LLALLPAAAEAARLQASVVVITAAGGVA